MVIIDESSKIPLYTQLYEGIKADIVNGTLKPGTKLQSSRTMSTELHLSRNTVELAYGQLFAEGFITSIQRKGYYVEALDMETFQQGDSCSCCDSCICHDFCDCRITGKCCDACTCHHQDESDETPNQDILYDFRSGKLLHSDLPCNLWQRLIGRCFHDYKEDLALQKSVFGEAGLRSEIQKHILNYRDVSCTAEQIIVTTGTQFCLDLACQLLKSFNRGLDIAMEEPGYDQSRTTFQNNGLNICPMELDKHGADVKVLSATNAIAAYITPSHQFPTGIVMPLSRRNELVEWARQKDSFIIEDDYNCHFQHGVRMLPSVQSLCADRVFYIGSFSNVLFPCLSVSYMVVPEKLLDQLHRRFDNYTPFVSFLTQKPLEMFMKEGLWEGHLRKMKKAQRIKCEALVDALNDRFGDSIHISAFHAGLHLLVRAEWPITEQELISRARRAGVSVYPTSHYWSRPEKGQSATVLLNYGGIPLKDIPDAVERLSAAWHDHDSGAMQDVESGSFALR